jgi:uncharacterized protein YecT (DUF1311 family)
MFKAAKAALLVGLAVGAMSLFVLPKTAQAAESADPCAAPQDQQSMNICAEADYQKADQQLTALYAKFKPIPPKLRLAERAWITYRDAECDFAGDSEQGGSMQPMIISGCLTTLTKERIETLKGDLAGL